MSAVAGTVEKTWIAKWTTDLNERFECQLYCENDRVIAQLFDTAMQAVTSAPFITDKQQIALRTIKECIQSGKKDACEWKVFRCDEPKILMTVMVKQFPTKELSIFRVNDLDAKINKGTEAYEKHIPFFGQTTVDAKEAIEFEPLPAGISEDLKPNSKTSDVGVTRYDSSGLGTKTVRICTEEGIDGNQTIYIFRKETEKGEVLEAKWKQWPGKSLYPLTLEEDADSKDRTIDEREMDIETTTPRLILNENGKLRSISFEGSSEARSTFASSLGRISSLPILQIRDHVLEKFVINNGRKYYTKEHCTIWRGVKKLSVGDDRYTPALHMRFSRSFIILFFKTPFAFVQSMVNLNAANGYKKKLRGKKELEVFLLNEGCKDALVPGPSTTGTQEDYQDAFAGCSTVDVCITNDGKGSTLDVNDRNSVVFMGRLGAYVLECLFPREDVSSSRNTSKDAPPKDPIRLQKGGVK